MDAGLLSFLVFSVAVRMCVKWHRGVFRREMVNAGCLIR